MPIDRRIAFLGAGNMAGALIEGLLRAGVCTAEQIVASDVREERLRELAAGHGIHTTTDNAEAARGATAIVLATKPQVFGALLADVAGNVDDGAVVVSVAAGVSISSIERRLGNGSRVVRAMPNTPALVGVGATAIAAGTNATEEDLALAETLFGSVGIVVRLPEERIDAVTGLSGSGPAYVFRLVEALNDAGAKVGLPREAAEQLAAQTVLGAATLLVRSGESAAALREKVSSPNGTTVAGLAALSAAGFVEAVRDAVVAATERSRELGEETAESLDG